MGIESIPGSPGAAPVEPGGNPPGGPAGSPGGEGAEPPVDSDAAPQGAGLEGEAPLLLSESSTANKPSLRDQALANQIQLSKVSHEGSAGADAHRSLRDSSGSHRQASERSHSDSYRAVSEFMGRAHAQTDVREVLQSDSYEVKEYFSKFCKGEHAPKPENPNAPRANSANPANLANPALANPSANPTGVSVRERPAPPTGPNTPTEPRLPYFPTVGPKLANLTPQRFANAQQRMVAEGGHSELQDLMRQLETACAEGNQADAESILAAHPELAAELANAGDGEGVGDSREVREGREEEGEGADGSKRREGSSREGGTHKVKARTFTNDDLNRGVTVFSGGHRGPNAEGEDHLHRMGTGIRVVCGGSASEFATRVATEGAVRGTYAEDDSGDDSSSGRGSGDSRAFISDLEDPSGQLAAQGFTLDYVDGVGTILRDEGGRAYRPQQISEDHRGDFIPEVRSAAGCLVRNQMLWRTAMPISGASAGRSGNLHHDQRC